MPGIPQPTLTAYLETDYCVFIETSFALRIGSVSESLLKLYRQHGADCAAFITELLAKLFLTITAQKSSNFP